VGSGFRSQDYQADVFVAQTARWGDEEVANRYSAKPGHSQHQLGTTIDFTDMFRGFRDSSAADWLRDNAHRFGFVLPYTAAAAPRTGYADEPWHGRWVGRSLAAQLAMAGYREWSDAHADDALSWVQAASA
jgi:zinc D-Ala-D-Ala carboxypeptidase